MPKATRYPALRDVGHTLCCEKGEAVLDLDDTGCRSIADGSVGQEGLRLKNAEGRQNLAALNNWDSRCPRRESNPHGVAPGGF